MIAGIESLPVAKNDFPPCEFGGLLWRMPPSASSLTRFQALACVGLIWAAIYLPGLGSLEIKGEEGRRLLPAVTMLETGRWIVPSIGGVDYLSKPPLINWLAAAAFAIAGDPHSEWAARAPSVLAVLALGLCTVAALGRWLGNAGAFMAAVFLLTNIGLMEKGRLAEIEALYLSLTGIAIVLWLGAWRRDVVERAGKPSWRAWTLPWVFLGLGMLTKGPLHLLFFYAVVAAVLVCAGRRRDWLNWPHLVGVVLMLGIFAAWAVPYLRQTAAGHSGGVWLEQFRGRMEVSEKFQLDAWLLNIPRGLVNYLPWTVLLPLAWRREPSAAHAENAGRRLDHAISRGLRWAIGGCFLAVSLAPGGQPRYTLPLLTPASLLLALALVRGRRLPASLPTVWARAVIIALGVAFHGAICAAVFGGGEPWRWAVAGGLLALSGWMCVRVWRGQRAVEPTGLALASAVVMALLTADYALGVVPWQRRYESVRPAAARIERLLDGEHAAVLRPGFLPMMFYLRPIPVCLQTLDALPPATGFILVREDELAGLAKELGEHRDALPVLRVMDKRARNAWVLVKLEPPANDRL